MSTATATDVCCEERSIIGGEPPQSTANTPDDIEARGACKIILPNGGGSGFLCQLTLTDDSGVKNQVHGLMTNNHVLNRSILSSQKNIELSFQFDHPIKQFYKGRETRTVTLTSKDMQSWFTCELLDATFIELNSKKVDSIKGINPKGYPAVEFLTLIDDREYERVKQDLESPRIKVIGYPFYPIEDFDGSKHLGGGEITEIRGFSIHHRVGTNPGSSGSPLLLCDSGKVIGLHKGAAIGNYNIAVSIAAIRRAIEYEKKHGSSQKASNEQLEALGFTKRFKHPRGEVYSYCDSGKEIWFTCTSHEYHCTTTNPVDVGNAYMFHELHWMPLQECDHELSKKVITQLEKLNI